MEVFGKNVRRLVGEILVPWCVP